MMRRLYRGLLALHPAAFQDRFGDELIWIFDIRDPQFSSSALVVDCVLSIVRQWLFHSRLWAFGASFLLNCIVLHKMIEFFGLGIGRLLASFL